MFIQPRAFASSNRQSFRRAEQQDQTDSTLLDFGSLSSAPKMTAIAPPVPAAAALSSGTAFINEIHYDNVGADAGEFIEVVAATGTNVTGWSIVLYNGNGGTSYTTTAFSSATETVSGSETYYVFDYPLNGIQNGSPDGIALVNGSGTVVQFLSYEGPMTATNGPASGLTATDIGVSEAGTEAIGLSLQLSGNGTSYSAFTWQGPAAATKGAANTGQTFGGGGEPGTLSIQGDVSVAEGDSGTTALTFTILRSGGSTGALSASYTLALGTADAADVGVPLPQNGTVNFADGETSKTITVEVNGDTLVEGDDTVTLNISGAAVSGTASATGTILNDDVVGGLTAFINEIHYDNDGTDTGEAVEIAGTAGLNLSGWTLQLYNGNGGALYSTINLSGVIADQDDGFGTLSFATVGLQNGSPDGIALVNASGDVVQFLSYEGSFTAVGGAADGLTSEDIGVVEDGSDAIGLSLQLSGTGNVYEDFFWTTGETQTFGGINAGQNFGPVNPNGSFRIGDAAVTEGNSGTTNLTFTVTRGGGSGGAVTVDYAVQFGSGAGQANAADLSGATSGTVSFADGETSKTFSIAVTGDTIAEPTESFAIILSNATGGANVADATATGTIVNDEILNLAVYEIQGAGHRSAYEGLEVTTTGIVTAIDSNGFYIQAAVGDGDIATSDGIFVFTGGAPSATGGTLAVGSAVTVQGSVQEFQPGNNAGNLTITEIVSPPGTVPGTGTIAATLIGPNGRAPLTNGNIDDDGLTSYDPTTDGIDFYESLEGMLLTVEKPVALGPVNNFGELWVLASDGAGNEVASDRTPSGGVIIEPGAPGLGITNSVGGNFHPERIQIQTDSGLGSGSLPTTTQGDVYADITGVLSYDFGNYELHAIGSQTITNDVTIAAEVTALEGTATALTIGSYNVENLDPSDPQARFDALAFDIAVNMNLPDVVALQEIQDNDGATNSSTVSASMTLQMLSDAIFAQSGVRYTVIDNSFIVDDRNGGEPGGNIRNAYLYRDDRVDLVAGSVATIGSPGTSGDAFDGSRPPLVATFTFGGEAFTVINNHFSSKGGSTSLFGAVQPSVNGSEDQRLAQAAAVNAYVDSLLLLDPDSNIAVTGDLNEFAWEEPLRVLTGELAPDGVSAGTGKVLFDLYETLPANERYDYVFDGNSQTLMGMYVTGNLFGRGQLDSVHINTISDLETSDHDPLVAQFETLVPSISGTPGPDTLTGTARGEEMFGLGGNDKLFAGGGDDALSGDAGNDKLYGEDGNDILDGGTGFDQMFGGQGHDLFIVDSTSDKAYDDVNGGTDQVRSSVTFSLSNNIEQLVLTGTANIAGVGNDLGNLLVGNDGGNTLSGLGGNDRIEGGLGNDYLTGDDGDDVLIGGEGNDVLDLGAGIDQAEGGAGDDTYRVNDAADTVVELANGGVDEVRSRVSFTLGDNIENLSLYSGAGTGTGNALDNVLRAGTGAETLLGLGGNDTLLGDAGRDTLIGGEGADILRGMVGEDTVTGGLGADRFEFREGEVRFRGGFVDIVTDFNRAEGDKIALNRIDAIVGGADDRFTFVGSAAFSGVAGELRFQAFGANTRIYADTNGDKAIDFQIELTGSHTLIASDFVL